MSHKPKVAKLDGLAKLPVPHLTVRTTIKIRYELHRYITPSTPLESAVV